MNYDAAETFLKSIGDKTRLTILKHIITGPLCVCDLTALLDISQPAVSQHMRKLKLAGIVIDEKRGRWTYWSVNAFHPQYAILLHLLSLLPMPERTMQDLEELGIKPSCSGTEET